MKALGVSFETADRSQPAKGVVADYYQRYENFYDLRVHRPTVVTSVFTRGTDLMVRHFDAEGQQQSATGVVVNATGTCGSPYVPWYSGLDNFRGRQVRTTDYVSAENFAGQSVVVVGGGTSAIGFLLELETVASELTWVSRRPIDFLDVGESNLEARIGAVAQQDEAARHGRVLPSIVSGTGVPRTQRIVDGIERGLLVAIPMFTSIEPDGVRFADGTFRRADVILWATGFRPDLRHLAPLGLRDKSGGISVNDGSADRDQRISFAGYGPQASTIGANRAGRSIARRVVATLEHK